MVSIRSATKKVSKPARAGVLDRAGGVRVNTQPDPALPGADGWLSRDRRHLRIRSAFLRRRISTEPVALSRRR